jgi:uncharacterized protein (TIGR02145 family)
MSGYANGNYILDARIGYNSGGINSTDALLVNRYFTSLISLTPLRARAGDVNGNQITNSGDALLISRRITNLLSSFAVGNYVNDKPTINAQGNPLSVSMRALSTGDVNGSFIVQPSAPTLVLDTVYGNGNVGTAVVRFTNPGSGVFERGIVWSSSPNPTISSNKSVAGKGGFGFTHSFGGVPVGFQYYVRAYARTSVGVYYSPERSFTPIPGIRCPGTPTVTDIDGNLYHTVQIGNQCWTQSNLKVSKYKNGDAIPTGLSNTAWQNTTAGAYAIYDNNPVNDGLYGKLYNHYAVIDNRGLCPTGWHVPTDGEWNLLTIYLDPNSDTGCFYINNHYCAPSCQISSLLKSTVTQPSLGGWISSIYPNTNASGFSGLGAGYRNHDYFNGAYLGLNNVGFWWSSTLLPPYASGRDIIVGNNCIAKVKHDLRFGFSVRCLKDIVPSVLTAPVLGITATSATTGGDVTQDGGAPVTARGVAYGTSSSPTTAGAITNDGIGTGVFTSTLTGLTPSTTYNVRAYATNSVGTAYGNELSFTTTAIPVFTCGTSTVSDVDGNSYNTVQIGTQCWTQSNLKVSKYRNGDSIPTVYNDLNWASLTYGAYCVLENNQIYNGVYGKLYNHFAVMDVRGICPTGWHVPSDFEWKILIRHLDASADTLCNVHYGHGCVPSTIAGGMLRNVAVSGNLGVSGWGHPNVGATNSSGFNALPGGWRHNTNGAFIGTTDMAYWWSYKLINAPSILLMSNTASIQLSQNEDYILKTNGNYVRCLKD